MAHPRYSHPSVHGEQHFRAHIDDAVAHAITAEYAGTITAIYLDGIVELSTGDQVPAAELVLLRRALDGAP